ncbi:MAG: BrnT family toxin [Pseudomonadota bacterium]
MLRFEWDPAKERKNVQKHGVSFEEARSVFVDPLARLITDPDHSENEERFVLLGFSKKLRTLVVCHCYRRNGEIVRIISARKATRTEQKTYWEVLK